MFFRKTSLQDQLAKAMLVPVSQLESGILGWTFRHIPVFIIEPAAKSDPENLTIHFTRQCRDYALEGSTWVSNALTDRYSFKPQCPVQFCPKCVSIIDQLFDPKLEEVGLKNHYEAESFFPNLTESFPYLFSPSTAIESDLTKKKATHQPVTFDTEVNCTECGGAASTLFKINTSNMCVQCASNKKLKETLVNYPMLSQALIEKYSNRKHEPSTWQEVLTYLPACWARLVTLFEQHQLPLPVLWLTTESSCKTHSDILPLAWPELNKAVVFEVSDAKIDWEDDLERWSFFDVLQEMN